MYRSQGYEHTAYKASVELSTGDMFELRWCESELPQTFDDPAETEEYDVRYYLNGKKIEESELPDEVTEDVLDRLRERAETDTSYQFGPDD